MKGAMLWCGSPHVINKLVPALWKKHRKISANQFIVILLTSEISRDIFTFSFLRIER